MTVLTLDEIKRQREFNYRRTPERRVRSVEEARAFVEEVGFCHFWPIKKVSSGDSHLEGDCHLTSDF